MNSTAVDLLADLLAPDAHPGRTPAIAAISAIREHPCGSAADFRSAIDLRFLRFPATRPGSQGPGIAEIATESQAANRPQSEHWRGESQKSQESQPSTPAGALRAPAEGLAPAWTDAEIARFQTLRARLLRWRWPEIEAEAMAARIVEARRSSDERVCCADCSRYRPGRCGNHRAAGLLTTEIGRELAVMPQRCPGFDLVPELATTLQDCPGFNAAR